MKCNCCGAEIAEGVNECPFCDAVVEKATRKEKMAAQTPTQSDSFSGEEEHAIKSQNSLVGKEYTFVSTRGTNFWGLFNSRIISNVKVAEDRLFIEKRPKKFNTIPAVLFEDIIGITIEKKINFYFWILIIASGLLGFLNPICFALTIFFIYCGLQRKITVSQRNGVQVVMYTGSKALAEEFKEDMKKVAKIQ